MCEARFNQYFLLAALLSISPFAAAFNVGASLGLGLGYTDNAGLAAISKEDDWIVDTSAAVTVSKDAGNLTAAVTTSLRYQDYLNDTYDSQNYFNLNGQARWVQIKNRLAWQVDDYFAQVPVDTLDPDTPDNIQDTNVFSFSPDIRIPVSARSSIYLKPLFQDYYYQTTDIDNQQYGLTASWRYNIHPTVTLDINGVITDAQYDNEVLNPGYTISTLQAVITRTLSRLQYSFNVGATNIDRDNFEKQEGMIGSFDLFYQLTGKSSLRAYLSSNLTDASNDLFKSAVDPDTGDFSNERATSDVLRNNVMRLTYSRDDNIIRTRLWSELRDLDYTESDLDLKVQSYGLKLDYRLTSMLTTGISGVYNETEQLRDGRVDKEYALIGNATYSLSRKLSCNFKLRYQQKDSSEAASEYDEVGVVVGLAYDIFSRRSSVQ